MDNSHRTEKIAIMDKFLAYDLIKEQLSNQELRKLVQEERQHIIELTSGLTLKLKGVRQDRSIEMTVIEAGKPNQVILMHLFWDFGLTDQR